MKKIEQMLNDLNVIFTKEENIITLDSYFGGILTFRKTYEGLIEIGNHCNDGMLTDINNLTLSVEWCIDEPILVLTSSFHSFKFNDVLIKENNEMNVTFTITSGFGNSTETINFKNESEFNNHLSMLRRIHSNDNATITYSTHVGRLTQVI